MVPHEFVSFFTVASAAAGTLIGLLFVAVSLRTDSIFGDAGDAGGRAIAGSAFIGLANAFVISIVALIPKVTLGPIAAAVAALSAAETIQLHRHLPGDETHRVMLTISVLTYGAQLTVSLLLAADRHDSTFVFELVYLVVAALVVALVRAWELLQGQHLRRAQPAEGDQLGP